MRPPFIKPLCLTILLIVATYSGNAREGMWMPQLLKLLNESEMQSMGMKISAEDIYSVNKSSIKDAVLQFGGGCTGSVISDQGLVITNHHCGYGAIAAHSTLENNYLDSGFYARTQAEELPNPKLTVRFIVKIEDVTEQILEGVTAETTETEREALVKVNESTLKEAAETGNHYQAIIKPIFYGAQYILFITEVFTDVRLVYAPPSSIGKYGGDTDNWMWPRHTGDFSIFRIYAGPNNQPNAYNKTNDQNQPFKPRYSLPLSLNGVKEGDFTFVYGFPGHTDEYISSHAVEQIMNQSDPKKIALRNDILTTMRQYMDASEQVKLNYASNYASTANYWKKWIGELRGLKRLHALEKKKQQEAELTKWFATNDSLTKLYGTLMTDLEQAYQQRNSIMLGLEYMREAVLKPGVLNLAYKCLQLAETAHGDSDTAFLAQIEKSKKIGTAHFDKTNSALEKEIFEICMQHYYNDVPANLHPEYFIKKLKENNNNITQLSNWVHSESMFGNPDVFNKIISSKPKKIKKAIENDPALNMVVAFISAYYGQIYPIYKDSEIRLTPLNRKLVQALRSYDTAKMFYPDANLTMRVAYGNVKPYYPYDGVTYKIKTTLQGVIEKKDTSVADFKLPPGLEKLYKEKDYGPYGTNDSLVVCFIASNHTTGGNSGSPVFNAHGQLLGINFDRNWEGTMSDIMYDPDYCRNITVDIRYVLFIMDKLSGASRLINELNLKKG